MDGLILTPTGTDLVIPVTFPWPSPDRIVEAIGDSTAKRAQAANRSAQDVIGDRFKLEKDTQAQLAKRFTMLKAALQQRLLVPDVTDFRRFTLQQLLDDVDRLIAQTQTDVGKTAERDYAKAEQLGIDAASEPLKAAALAVHPALPGIDTGLVQAAFGNTVDLLTPPMVQFATQVKMAIRGVSLAGDNKFGAIQKLRDQIEGQGFDNAQYRAERIIRTELGRVFNQATFDRLLVLAEDFPFLRKGWRATKDSRTRLGHVQAGQTYARGHGIPVKDRFEITVYDERDKKNPRAIGKATLLFPVDPGVKPEGRIGAGATIMCRCNGFVDFDLGDFASYTKAKVATALGQVPKPQAPPKPAEPVDDTALGQSLKGQLNYYGGTFYMTKAQADDLLARIQRPGAIIKAGKRGFYIQDPTGAKFGPSGWGAAPKPKLVVPVVKVPTAAQVTPQPVVVGPVGPKVSAAADLNPANPGYKRKALALALQAKVKAALDVIDSVHGDGALSTIPVTAVASQYRRKAGAYFEHGIDGRPRSLGFGAQLMKTSPYMTVTHETGHWLDQAGVGNVRTKASSASFATDVAGGDPALLAAVKKWQAAVRNSQAIQTLSSWNQANLPGSGKTAGDGTIPLGVHRQMVSYLLSSAETWARSYAQYIAVTSGNKAALAELRNMQASSATALKPVARTTPYGATPLGAKPRIDTETWDYPWQWQDDDFKPIAEAFDEIFRVAGWRK